MATSVPNWQGHIAKGVALRGIHRKKTERCPKIQMARMHRERKGMQTNQPRIKGHQLRPDTNSRMHDLVLV